MHLREMEGAVRRSDSSTVGGRTLDVSPAGVPAHQREQVGHGPQFHIIIGPLKLGSAGPITSLVPLV